MSKGLQDEWITNEYPQHMFSWRNKKNACITFFHLKQNDSHDIIIGLDKGGYAVNIFSPRKHMLWVLIRST